MKVSRVAALKAYDFHLDRGCSASGYRAFTLTRDTSVIGATLIAFSWNGNESDELPEINDQNYLFNYINPTHFTFLQCPKLKMKTY